MKTTTTTPPQHQLPPHRRYGYAYDSIDGRDEERRSLLATTLPFQIEQNGPKVGPLCDDYYSNNSNDDDDGPLRIAFPRSHRRPMTVLRSTLLALGLLAASSAVLEYMFLQSHVEYERSLPFLGMSWRKYEAQRVANNYLQYLLDVKQVHDDTDDDHHHDDKSNKGPFQAPDGCEGSVVILRHCEKGNVREHCSYAGYERAMYLSTVFGDDEQSRWPLPSYLYALATGHRHNPTKRNFREVETLEPLADKAQLDMNEDYDTHHTSGLAKDVFAKLRSGDLCGKIAVVSWKHSDIPHLAHKFGCGPDQGCPEDYPSDSFDRAWQIKFVYEKSFHSEFKSGWLPNRNTWQVYGSVQQEGFDPLQFSKQAGDYQKGGTPHGARWRNFQEEVPERMTFKYSKKNLKRNTNQ